MALSPFEPIWPGYERWCSLVPVDAGTFQGCGEAAESSGEGGAAREPGQFRGVAHDGCRPGRHLRWDNFKNALTLVTDTGTSLFDFSHPFYSSMGSVVTVSLWLVWNVWQRQTSIKRSLPSWAKWKRCDLARLTSQNVRDLESFCCQYLPRTLVGHLVQNVWLHPSSHNLFVEKCLKITFLC